MNRVQIYVDINAERKRQDAKWGADRNLSPYLWLTILTEEVGEVARAILEADWDKPARTHGLRAELVQVAAVAVAAIENIDRAEAEALQE